MLTIDLRDEARQLGETERLVLIAALEIASREWGHRSEDATSIHNEVVYRMQANQADRLVESLTDSELVLVHEAAS